MAWDNVSTVTNAGAAMLNESLAGRSVYVTYVVGGTGTMEESELADATDLTERKQTLEFLGIENCTMDADDGGGETNGKKIGFQISNQEVEEGYLLQQIGVFAKLDGESTDTLFFIMQSEAGIEVPNRYETRDYLVEMYAVICVANNARIVVNSSPDVLVPRGLLEQRLSEAIKEHNKSPDAHEEAIKTSVQEETIKEIRRLIASGEMPGGGGGGGYYDACTITVPASGWTAADTPSADHAYTCDVELEDCTEELVPSATCEMGYFGIASKAGLLPACETKKGQVRFFSKEIPDADIKVFLVLFDKKEDTGNGLEYDAEGHLNVKLGSGLKFDDTKSIAIDEEVVFTDKNMANNEEVMQSVKDILNIGG